MDGINLSLMITFADLSYLFLGYINDGHASLKHQRAPDLDRFTDDWYQRGQRAVSCLRFQVASFFHNVSILIASLRMDLYRAQQQQNTERELVKTVEP